MAASMDDFCADGFLVARGAVAPDVVCACVDVIENELRARGVEPPGTWTEPVVRFPCPTALRSRSQASRRRSWACTTPSSVPAVGFSARESVEPFRFGSLALNGGVGKGRTGTFFLPEAVAELVRQGKELGEADDIVFSQVNSKQDQGAIGLLAGNVVDRTQLYTHAVILALIPFKNRVLYGPA
jgi:Protein of unknown function DUF84